MAFQGYIKKECALQFFAPFCINLYQTENHVVRSNLVHPFIYLTIDNGGKQRMRKNSVLILIFFMFIMPVKIVVAEEVATEDNLDGTFKQLEQISDEALQMVKLSRYNDGKRMLEYFSEKFLTVTTSEPIFSMDELRIVSVSHNEALEALKREDVSHEVKVKKVTQFRLAADAVVSSHAPLWTKMEDQVLSVLYEVQQAVANGKNEQFHVELNSFLTLYEMIYPSLKIDVPVDTMQNLETRVQYIDQYRPQVMTEVVGQRELEVLEDDLKIIFAQAFEEDEADPSLWWVIITTGSVIFLSLSYAGWRKYKGTKHKKKTKDNPIKRPND